MSFLNWLPNLRLDPLLVMAKLLIRFLNLQLTWATPPTPAGSGSGLGWSGDGC